MITIYEYPLQMIVPEERHQDGYDNLGQDKHITYELPPVIPSKAPRYYFFSHKIFCRKNFVVNTIQLGQLYPNLR